jgi:sensor histidine kinase YesM
MKNIKNMIATYLEETDAAITARRGRMADEYLIHYKESTKVRNYINEYIQQLNNTLFLQNTNQYVYVKNSFYFVETLNIILILSVVVISIGLIFLFTYKITNPITELSKTADEISHGNFDVPNVRVDSHDEIGVMADAFNRMTGSIKQYINEIKEKAQLESRLKVQEMENLIIKSDLKEAELHALQSQINPHFLYNTLNTGAQLAMLEGADKAYDFIEKAAALFRYNLRNLDKPVTISDEIKNIENYMHLLNVRFADKLEFTLNYDESLLDIKIPCMILQPIVENAYIHGVGDLDGIGRISLDVYKRGQNAEISIKDNGKGMSKEKIKKILSGDAASDSTVNNNKSHTSGIAMNNILSRLKIFYNLDNIIEIQSEINHGTEVILRIPIQSA